MSKRNGATRNSSGFSARSKRRRSRAGGRRERGEQRERSQANAGWIEWGGELIWAVGFTSGGAPYGLRVCDFDRADLEAMELDVAALKDAGQHTPAQSEIQESNGSLSGDDVPF